MKTFLENIRTLLRDNSGVGNTIDWVSNPNNIRLVTPRHLPVIVQGQIPFIGIAGIDKTEVWVTNNQKQASYSGELYIINDYQQEELVLTGQSQNTGLLQMILDVEDVMRNEMFDNWLSTPMQIERNDIFSGEGDLAYVIVAILQFSGTRIFNSSL